MSELPFVGGLIVIGLALTYNNYFTDNYVYVEIDEGILRGFNTTTWRGIPYFSFKGIPYAKPPLGELRFKEEKIRRPGLFGLVVEESVKSEEVFSSDSPSKMLKSGNYKTVSYMTGYNSQEAYMHGALDPKKLRTASEFTDHYIPLNLNNTLFRMRLAKSIRTFYFNDTPITTENIKNYINLVSDTDFISDINRATKLLLQTSNATVYFYVFSYSGGQNIYKLKPNDIKLPSMLMLEQVQHTATSWDIYFTRMCRYYWQKPAIGSDDEHVLHTMIRLWTNFAKYGNPTPAGDPLSWNPMTLNEFNYLNISGRDTKMDVNPDFERANFWTEVYDEYEALQR